MMSGATEQNTLKLLEYIITKPEFIAPTIPKLEHSSEVITY